MCLYFYWELCEREKRISRASLYACIDFIYSKKQCKSGARDFVRTLQILIELAAKARLADGQEKGKG
jgi:hypothetical protein